MYDWAFTPDAADIARNKGYNLGVTGGKAFDTERKAIWHGKWWIAWFLFHAIVFEALRLIGGF